MPMLRALSTAAILCWALIGPAVCEAACALPAEKAPPACHAAAGAPDGGARPDGPAHSEKACCDAVVFTPPPATSVELPLDLASRLTGGAEAPSPELVEPDALPRPPDLARSPYVRVTPPRLVFAPA